MGKKGSFQDHVHGAIKAPHKAHDGKASFGERTPHHRKTAGPGGKTYGDGASPQQDGLRKARGNPKQSAAGWPNKDPSDMGNTGGSY